ncbi:MAG: hypothetical protein Q4D74_02950 [Comamonadaceae bacterium]|nr:hypothetical protein [Comamonadaceae bacterium]
MSTLRLGAYKLPAAEIVLVQTLLRLYSHGGAFRWTYVTEPPYDALLADGTTPEGQHSSVDAMAKAVLRLTRMNAGGGANTLERPIRADLLQEWLKKTEHDLLDTRPMTTTFGASDGLAAPTAPAELPATVLRFKLRRWPPASLLRGDPTRIRLATLLSRRALNASEMASISRQPLSVCQEFLQTLQTTGLVDVQSGAPAPMPGTGDSGAPAMVAPAPAVASPPKPTFARSLISGIRRRLGL